MKALSGECSAKNQISSGAGSSAEGAAGGEGLLIAIAEGVPKKLWKEYFLF
jgi:hypothetical protein